jgi:hypothetical protein
MQITIFKWLSNQNRLELLFHGVGNQFHIFSQSTPQSLTQNNKPVIPKLCTKVHVHTQMSNSNQKINPVAPSCSATRNLIELMGIPASVSVYSAQ